MAKIAYPFYSKSAPEAAANALVKEAYKKWKIVRILLFICLQEEEVIDDITCVIVFFDERLISNSLKAKATVQTSSAGTDAESEPTLSGGAGITNLSNGTPQSRSD